MLHFDYYLCLMELARRDCSTAGASPENPFVGRPCPWPFGVALLLVALSTTVAALWQS